MTVIVAPLFTDIAKAIDYLETRGCVAFYLWRGPDGLIRGHGTKQVPAA